MIDIGANLTHRAFDDDRAAVVRYAREQADVKGIVVIGTTLFNRRQRDAMRGLLREHPGFVHGTVGVHPHNAERELERAGGDAVNDSAASVEALARALEAEVGRLTSSCSSSSSPPAVVVAALGETGLDYARRFSFDADQKAVFSAHLIAARRLRLPLFLHEREAFDDMRQLLDAEAAQHEDQQHRAVVHCFSGGEREAAAYLARGFMLGFTGIVCMPDRGAPLRDLLSRRLVPLDRILVETDAPYLTPRAARSRLVDAARNEPAALGVIVDCIADLMGEDREHVRAATEANARSFFGLDTEQMNG